MTELHRFVAYAVPAGFGVLVVMSVICYFSNKEPGGWYWNTLAVLQVVLGIQFIVGAILFVSGATPDSNGPTWLHYIYGAGFPLLVLIVAHRQSRKHPGAEMVFFGVAAFLCTFSTLRALQTGLGID
jgi:hypothetical protein